MTRRPLTYGTTARLGARGLAAIVAVGLAVLAAFMVLALSPDPATLTARPAALSALTLAGPAIVGSVAGVASAAVAAHGARHIGGAASPTSAELATAARVEVLP